MESLLIPSFDSRTDSAVSEQRSLARHALLAVTNSLKTMTLRSLPRLDPPPATERTREESQAPDKQKRARRSLPSLLIAVLMYFVHVLQNLIEAIRRWQRDDADLLAGNTAYYAMLSLFPLMIVLIAGLGVFLSFTNIGHDAELYVIAAIEQGTNESAAAQVGAAFKQIRRQALLTGPLAMAGLIIAGMAVFAQIDRALDKIWKIEQPPFDSYTRVAWRILSQRLKAFVVLLCLGIVVTLIFFADMAFELVATLSAERFPIAESAWRGAKFTLSIVLNTIVFTAVYRLLSKVPVGWLHAARGGLLAAITWEVGRIGLAAFLINDHYSAYGVVGSLLAVMLWAYYASSVLFLGAEYVQVIREHQFRDSFYSRVSRLSTETAAPAVVRLRLDDLPFEQWTEGISKRAA